MPKIIPMNLPPVKSIYKPNDINAYASLKQKNFIIILCEKKNIPVPYIKHMKSGEASVLISRLKNE